MIKLIVLFTVATCTVANIAIVPDWSKLPLTKDLLDTQPFVLPTVHTLYPDVTPVVPKPISTLSLPTVPTSVIPNLGGTEIKSQYYIRDLHGQARYGHEEPFQNHHAFQDASGNKIGRFSYIDPQGRLRQTNYIADAFGYRASSNDLPTVGTLIPPTPVIDTPEVTAAKIAHLAEVEKAKITTTQIGGFIPPLPIEAPEPTVAKVTHLTELEKIKIPTAPIETLVPQFPVIDTQKLTPINRIEILEPEKIKIPTAPIETLVPPKPDIK